MAAEGTAKLRFAATASGTPMEWLPPRTMETVGLVMPAISSAMARPASTSPPTVLSKNRTPSMSSDASSFANSGSMCSYLVVLVLGPASVWPSICPTMLSTNTDAPLDRTMDEPVSRMFWVACSDPLSFSPASPEVMGLVDSVIKFLLVSPVVSAVFTKSTPGPGFLFLCAYGIMWRNGTYRQQEGFSVAERTKQRIVVKVGTSTLTHDSGALDLRSMEHLVRTLADLHGMGHEVILVTSGAIAVGTAKLGLSERPQELRMKQAAAAVGQCRMMHIYDKLFSEYNRSVAQILLTGDDVEIPQRAEHLRSTFSALLEMGVIPVVNENDSVSSAEIETGRHKVLGDNDTLSAIVARLCGADLLVLLSDIDGLYDDDPHKNKNAKLLPTVYNIDEVRDVAGGAGTSRGTGGMVTKLEAAERATNAGIHMIIANGNNVDSLYDILNGKPVGTLFVSKNFDKEEE